MDHRVSKDMISSGMTPSGQKNQKELGGSQYGSAATPNSLVDAYRSIYEHHQKDENGNTVPHDEDVKEGKINPGLQAYLDKKKGKKGNGDKEEKNGKNGKGSKPDFLDLDKDGDKKESMKKASKEMKKEGVDLFDLVKGKLIDEGYDEQEAIKIMVNLSEDQLKEISEGIKTAIGVGAALAAPYLMKKFLKPKTDKMLDTQRKTSPIGGDKRSGSDFQSGVNAIRDAKKKGGLMNQSTRDALNNPGFQ